MINTTRFKPLPKPGLLRWEIGIAVLLKIILLTGLWFLIFRWPDTPVSKPDVAGLFALPVTPALPIALPLNDSSQLPQESNHVR